MLPSASEVARASRPLWLGVDSFTFVLDKDIAHMYNRASLEFVSHSEPADGEMLRFATMSMIIQMLAGFRHDQAKGQVTDSK